MALSSLSHRPSVHLRGFTLIELLVVTGIMVVITGIVLASNSKFGGVIQLENLAYDIALSVRQAQVYGISVARFGDTFAAGYGMHFDIASPSTYILFADTDGNGLYDCDNPTNPTPENCELVETTTITRGGRITGLCSKSPGQAEVCGAVSKLDTVFIRPEPDAWISAGSTCTPLQTGGCKEEMRVILTSPKGDQMSVIVGANGQITVRRGGQ